MMHQKLSLVVTVSALHKDSLVPQWWVDWHIYYNLVTHKQGSLCALNVHVFLSHKLIRSPACFHSCE